jgi:uncharacterized protein (TIGR00369 family)
LHRAYKSSTPALRSFVSPSAATSTTPRTQPGAVYFKALDDASFFAANSLIESVFVLTVSFNLYFLRPISEGEIVATGRVVSRSKRLIVADGVLVDGRGREIARGSGTFMSSAITLSAEIGYG